MKSALRSIGLALLLLSSPAFAIVWHLDGVVLDKGYSSIGGTLIGSFTIDAGKITEWDIRVVGGQYGGFGFFPHPFVCRPIDGCNPAGSGTATLVSPGHAIFN